MKLWHFPYEISSPWHGQGHAGALIKVELEDTSVGYADLHPWPELGDPNLENCIKSLVNGVPLLPIVMQATRLSVEDAQARAAGRALVMGHTVPLSHRLLSDMTQMQLSQFNDISSEGFTHLKVKMGRDLSNETVALKRWVTLTSFKWRLDFNGRLSSKEFVQWYEAVQSWLDPYLDGIEDPVSEGEDLPIDGPFFADRGGRVKEWGVVWKPEVAVLPERISLQRVWVTNNLGHPFGHAVAAVCAARLGRSEICGLQGLESYPKSAWTEAIRYYGAVTTPLSGTGFGGDELLEKISWKKLK